MTSALTLAAHLAALSDDELTALIENRKLPRKIGDFYDLAEALLEPASLQPVLGQLDRHALGMLAAIAAGRPVALGSDAAEARFDRLRASALAYVEGGGLRTYDGVRALLRAWPSMGLPSIEDLIGSRQPFPLVLLPTQTAADIDPVAAERAFHTVQAVAELLLQLDREPARELQKGGLSLPDTRRVAMAMGVDTTTVPALLWLAYTSELIARDGSLVLTTAGAERWLRLTTALRWQELAISWLAALPDAIRELLGERAHTRWGSDLHEVLEWLMPAAGEMLVTLSSRFEPTSELLGIRVGDIPSSYGSALLAGSPEDAVALLVPHLPGEVDKVYVQQDLSIVAPGPLAPAVDARLRALADVESRALASTYRVSASSIERAIGAGETAESLRGFLEAISLTGIPQPLDYLISESASRYGRVRVRDQAAHAAFRTVISSSDPALISQIAVDKAFLPLSLQRIDDSALGSRFARDVVYWAFADARYPVVAEDAKGKPVSVRKRHAVTTASLELPDRAGQLVKRLREKDAGEPQSPTAWLTRQLEVAVRDRRPLLVTVGLPGGDEQEFTIEPTGVGGGRMRGRDRRAGVERTLPLASITAVRPL
ncbi:helicase-associated domain-containing protein [Gryllotalpicola sp.]|uniref:helicase-associated domain-containing protein n=1 Tax=Gryllotalpicola sp. TaxID=1932787 RepID=UPI0026190648|nr:helicase-associated domain-containing protein [Gryllotalpicola sp.]